MSPRQVKPRRAPFAPAPPVIPRSWLPAIAIGSPLGAWIGGFLFAFGLASLFGAWRRWCVPPQAFEAGLLPDLPGVASFIIYGALLAAILLIAVKIWTSRSPDLLPGATAAALQRAAWPLFLAWLPIGGPSTDGRIWTVYWIILVAGLSIFILAHTMLRAGAKPLAPSPRWAMPALIVLMLLVGASYTLTTCLGLRGMYNGSYTDFGGYHSAAWNSLHGRWMYADQWGGSIWAEHLDLWFVLPTLTLWISERAELLLAWQAFALASAAIPIFYFALRDTGHRGFAFALALAWLLSPFLGRNTMFEFHPLFFAAPALAWLFWAATNRRLPGWGVLLFGLAALLVREDMPLPVLAIGLWIALRGGRRRVGFALVGLSILWGLFALNCFMPSFKAGHLTWQWGGAGHIDRYSHLGGSYGEIIKTFLTRPGFVFGLIFNRAQLPNYALLIIPLALLPLCSPIRLLLCVPVFFLHAFSNWGFQNQLDVHYSSPLLPALFFAASGGAANLARRATRLQFIESPPALENPTFPTWIATCTKYTFALLAATFIAHLFTERWLPGIPPPLSPYDGRRHMTLAAAPFHATIWQQAESQSLFQELRNALPTQGGVAAQDPAIPQLSNRPTVRALRHLDAKNIADIDFAIFGMNINSYADNNTIVKCLELLVHSPDFKLAWARSNLMLFARKSRWTPDLETRFFTLGATQPDTGEAWQAAGALAQQGGNTEMLQQAITHLQSLQRARAPQSATPQTPAQ